MTDHPLTETAAAVLWNAHRGTNALPFHAQGRLYVQSQTAMLRAAFDAGREHERTTPAEEADLPTEFGDVLLDPRWGARSYARALHLGEGVWAAEVTPGADVYTHLTRDLTAFTLPDGTRARRDGKHEDGTPRFIKADQ